MYQDYQDSQAQPFDLDRMLDQLYQRESDHQEVNQMIEE